VDGQSKLVLDHPRSVWKLLATTFELYRRVPVFFLVLAAIIVVPYEVIVLAVTGNGPFAQGHMAFVPRQLLLAIDSFLVTPLISALHVRAVREVGDGGQPRLLPTLRRSLPTLPVVVVAAGVSSVAITIGTFALAVPGLILWAIWAVVAQTAALERGSWIEALRRSADLTRGHRWHALGLVFVAALIAGVPWLPLVFAFGHTTTTGASFLAGTALQVLLRSFEALITALLYFDLKARPRGGAHHIGVPEWDPNVPVSEAPSGTGDPLTPDAYTDADRPRGWYIDLESPRRMRYWAAGDKPAWSQRTAKMPKQTLVEWEELNARREEET
jgi:hypothetical protein